MVINVLNVLSNYCVINVNVSIVYCDKQIMWQAIYLMSS